VHQKYSVTCHTSIIIIQVFHRLPDSALEIRYCSFGTGDSIPEIQLWRSGTGDFKLFCCPTTSLLKIHAVKHIISQNGEKKIYWSFLYFCNFLCSFVIWKANRCCYGTASFMKTSAVKLFLYFQTGKDSHP